MSEGTCTCGVPDLLGDHHNKKCPNWRVIRIDRQQAAARVAAILDADSEFTTHHMDRESRNELLDAIVGAVLGD